MSEKYKTPDEVHAANAMLMLFLEEELSWIWSLDLLKCDDHFVRFFAANLLLTKVKRHWMLLSKDQRIDIFNFLHNTLQQFGLVVVSFNDDVQAQQSLRLFLNRLGMVFAIVCCQSENLQESVILFADFAIKMMLDDEGECNSLGIVVGCDLLSLLPEKVEMLDVSRAHRLELSRTLASTLDHILQHLDILVARRGGQFSYIEACSVLTCLRQWKNEGISLCKVASDDYSNLTALMLNCTSADTIEVMRLAIGLIADLVQIGEYPRPSTRDRIIDNLLEAVTGGENGNSTLLRLIEQPEVDMDALNEICCGLSAIGETEVSYIVSESGYRPQFFNLMLLLTKVRPCRLAIHAYDFWLALEDLPSSVRGSLLDGQMHVLLLQAIVRQVSYFHRGATLLYDDGDEDDEEDETNIAEFIQCQGTEDTLLMILRDVGAPHFFGLLRSGASLLDEPQAVRFEDVDPVSWTSLESAMSVVIIVMGEIKTNWDVLLTASPSSNVASSESNLSSVGLVLDALTFFLSHPLRMEFPSFVLLTVCKLVGAATFMLCINDESPYMQSVRSLVETSRQLFEPALNFLFDSFGASATTQSVRKAACSGILRLCTHGVKNLIQSHGIHVNEIIVGVTTKTAFLIVQSSSTVQATVAVNQGEVLQLVQSVCQVISNIDQPLHASQLLNILGEPIREQLQGEISSSHWSALRIVELLGLISHVVRYARPPIVTGPSAAALAEFLYSMWSHINVSVNTCLDVRTPSGVARNVLDGVFHVYENAVIALPDIFVKGDVLTDMIERCLQGFAERHCASAMKCLAAVVSALCFQASHEEQCAAHCDQLLSGLLLNVIDTMSESVRATGIHDTGQVLNGSWSWANEPEAIEQLFVYIYQYFLVCPHVVLSVCETPIQSVGGENKSLAHALVELSLVCLGEAKEREVVRKILLVLQAMWIPLVSAEQGRYDPDHYLQVMFVPSLGYVPNILRFIMESLDGQVQTSLWPIVTETLYTLLTISCDNGLQQEAMGWLYATFVDDNALNIPEREKAVATQAMLRFASAKNTRRFKALVSDIGKVCANELDNEALLDYSL